MMNLPILFAATAVILGILFLLLQTGGLSGSLLLNSLFHAAWIDDIVPGRAAHGRIVLGG